MHNVHEPYEVPPRFTALYPASRFCKERLTLQGMVSVADELVGNLTSKLQALDLWQNTVLVFTSDNGGDPTVGGNAPFKGGKATLFEGGIRAATFVFSELLPRAVRGSNVTHMTHISDWYHTFSLLAGVNPTDDHPGVFPIDGVDLWPYLSDPAAHAGNYSAIHPALVLSKEVVIVGPHKLIVAQNFGWPPVNDWRQPNGSWVRATPATTALRPSRRAALCGLVPWRGARPAALPVRHPGRRVGEG